MLYMLGEKYIASLERMGSTDNAKVVVLPADLQEAVRGLFGGKAELLGVAADARHGLLNTFERRQRQRLDRFHAHVPAPDHQRRREPVLRRLPFQRVARAAEAGAPPSPQVAARTSRRSVSCSCRAWRFMSVTSWM